MFIAGSPLPGSPGQRCVHLLRGSPLSSICRDRAGAGRRGRGGVREVSDGPRRTVAGKGCARPAAPPTRTRRTPLAPEHERRPLKDGRRGAPGSWPAGVSHGAPAQALGRRGDEVARAQASRQRRFATDRRTAGVLDPSPRRLGVECWGGPTILRTARANFSRFERAQGSGGWAACRLVRKAEQI